MICVGGGSMKRFGFLDKVEAYLKEAGMEVKLFEGIEPDPSVETVMRGAEEMLKFEPDWIVAIGGGSPIDAAKAMWIKYEYPDITFEDMCKVFGIPPLRKKAHFCAISSTSGTATEVTAFSIITDYEKGIKYPIADFEITPDVAIVDPELAETMPQKLVAHTGMDAITHAIEAYVSTANCDFTDPLALHAIEMIQTDLIPSYNGDMEKRHSMHHAQCLAGMAFSNALLGIVHSMAHKTGAAFADYGAHIIHGAANAMYLPKVIAFNAKDETAKKRYGKIADFMKLGGSTDEEKVDLLIIDVMMPRLDGIRATLKIREKSIIPIIILSAKSEDSDKIIGLDVGADDYITKPFNPLELIARVKSQIRRYTRLGTIAEPKSNVYSVGGLEIDDECKEVKVDGEIVKLTPFEYNILLFLVKNPGRVFTIDQIYEAVWNEEAVAADNTVAVHIRHIREKIEINPKEPRYLKVVWGVGYKIEKQ